MPGTTLVTGASSGIGRELARLAAKDRRDVVLVARRRERLEALADELTNRYGVAAEILSADLSLPDSPARVSIQVPGPTGAPTPRARPSSAIRLSRRARGNGRLW